MRFFPLLLLAAGIATAANAPITTVGIYRDDSLLLARGAVRIVQVVDHRVLGKSEPRLLGSASVGVFQERMWLQSTEPVASSVQRLLVHWLPDSAKDTAIRRVRVEILSFESWTVPTTNPAKASARVRLRFMSDDSAHPGKLAEAEAGADRDGPNSPEDQAELLRLSLRKAVLAFLGQGWKNAQPILDSSSAPAPDPWTDALKRSGPDAGSALRTLAHGSIGIGLGGYDFGVRGIAYHEPETGWNSEYWAALRLRDPSMGVFWSDSRFSDPTVFELAGGLGWQRRLGAEESPWVAACEAGGIFGNEWHADHGDRKNGPYFGIEGRAGGRWEPVSTTGFSGEAGLQTALRFNTIQIFNLGVYLEGGWRF